MKKEIRVSVIYVNYLAREKLLASIASLISTTKNVSYEIVVVDNEGDDKLKEKLSKFAIKIKYIRTGKNLGFGTACNVGARVSNGRYLFFLNPDTLVIDDALKPLIQFLETNKTAGGAGPVQIEDDGKLVKLQGTKTLTPHYAIFSLSLLSRVLRKNRFYKEYYLTDWNEKDVKEVGVIPGTAIIVRSSLFNKIGGFDTNYFLYFEESDLCMRIKKLGYKLYLLPESRIAHEHEHTTKKQPKEEILNHFRDSRYYYFKKHYGFLKGLLSEALLRTDVYIILLSIVLFVGFFLRFYNFESLINFGGEHGADYIRMKNYYEAGELPLTGPITSRSWIKLSPLFYWLFIPVFTIGRFNPIFPAALISMLGLITAVLNYYLTRKHFGNGISLISSTIYVFSPFWLSFFNSSFYYTLVIPLSILFYFSLFKALKGNVSSLYLSSYFLGLMLNFHFSAFYLIPLFLILIYASKKYFEVKQYLNSFLFFLLSVFPYLVSVAEQGILPYLKFAGWVPYRILGFMGVLSQNNFDENSLVTNMYNFIEIFSSQLTENYASNGLILSILLLLIYLLKLNLRKKDFRVDAVIHKNHKLFLFIIAYSFLVLILFGATPLHYYMPVFYPIVIVLSYWIYLILRSKKILIYLFPLMILTLNIRYYFSENWFYRKSDYTQKYGVPYKLQKTIAKKILEDAGGRSYKLKRVGNFDYYDYNFAMHYRYLLWLYGNEPKENKIDLTYTIYEGRKSVEMIPAKEKFVFNEGGVTVARSI